MHPQKLSLWFVGLALAGMMSCSHQQPAAAAQSGAQSSNATTMNNPPNGPGLPPSLPAQEWAGAYHFTYTEDLPGVEHEIWSESGTAYFKYYQWVKGRHGYFFDYKGASRAQGSRHYCLDAGMADTRLL